MVQKFAMHLGISGLIPERLSGAIPKPAPAGPWRFPALRLTAKEILGLAQAEQCACDLSSDNFIAGKGIN